MNDGSSQGGFETGFTIVETMIVLAITGLMLMSALYLILGQQNKVQFTQSIQEIQSAIQQTMSEVNAGYYPKTNLACNGTQGVVDIRPGINEQGTNNGCIFLGKAIQFGVKDSDPQEYIVHTIAGLQDNTGTLASARPKAIAQGQATNTAADFPDASIKKILLYGLRAVSMYYVNKGVKTPIGAVAFVSGLGSYQGTQLLSGTQQIVMVPVDGSDTGGGTFATTTGQVVDAINTKLADSPVNPSGGVQICFASGGTNQSGLVTLGSNGRSISVKLDIKSTKDCT